MIATANPNARVLIGTPTWPNHPPIIRATGLQIVEYPYYDRENFMVRFDDMLAALDDARPGDVVLLHGCCHNPTGADLSTDEWAAVASVCAERKLLPFVDIAYQGFGRGLEEDAGGVRLMLRSCGEVIIAQSCDKNFSVYRDRVGSLFVKTASTEFNRPGDGSRLPARTRDVVDAARPWRSRRADRARHAGAEAALAG